MTAVLLLLAFANAGPSDPEAARQGARAKVDEAERLFEAGRHAEAEARLREAYRLVPSPNLHYTFGRMAEVGGRSVEALEAFERFLRESRQDDADIADQRQDARQMVQALEGLVGVLDLRCNRDGAEVVVDGQVRGRTPLAAPLRMPPGAHRVVVRSTAAAGPFVTDVELNAGERLRVETYLQPVAPAPAVPLAVSAAPAPPEPRRTLLRNPWFWTAAGAVVVTAGGALYLALREGPAPLCEDCNWGVSRLGGK